MRPASFSEKGVTLIETLVALFVIALMATAGAIMTGQSLRGARTVEEKGSNATDLAVFTGMIADDLAAFVARRSQDTAEQEPASLFEGYAPRHDGRVMLFVRNGWANPSGAARSDLQRVEYVFAGGKLLRRSWAAADPTTATAMAEMLLVDGVSNLDVRFGRADTWQSEWIVLPGGDMPLPQKAEFRLTFSAGDELTLRVLVGGGA